MSAVAAFFHCCGAVSLGAVGLWICQRVYAHASRTEAQPVEQAERLAARNRLRVINGGRGRAA